MCCYHLLWRCCYHLLWRCSIFSGFTYLWSNIVHLLKKLLLAHLLLFGIFWSYFSLNYFYLRALFFICYYATRY